MRAHIATMPVPTPLPKLADGQIAELADLLRTLGEPTRLRILFACLAQPASVGEIAARVQPSSADVAGKLLSEVEAQRQADHLFADG